MNIGLGSHSAPAGANAGLFPANALWSGWCNGWPSMLSVRCAYDRRRVGLQNPRATSNWRAVVYQQYRDWVESMPAPSRLCRRCRRPQRALAAPTDKRQRQRSSEPSETAVLA